MKFDRGKAVPAWITLSGGSVAHCTLDRRRTVCGRELNADDRDSRSVILRGSYMVGHAACLRCSSKLPVRGWVKLDGHSCAHFIRDVGEDEMSCGQPTYRHEPDLQAQLALYARKIREHGGVPDPVCPACLRRSV